MRLDDIDAPRSTEEAAQIALSTLANHGLIWDGIVQHQTNHCQHYERAIEILRQQNLVFYCTCSRKKLKRSRTYPGYCRSRIEQPSEPAAIRVHVPSHRISFQDRVQGEVNGNLAESDGDFIVMRKEFITAYPLAVIVDDHLMGVTDVVRGADLLENTLAQLFLIRTLGFTEPRYAHIPVLNQRDDIKLSKRDQAVAIDNNTPWLNLISTLQLLGMKPPAKLRRIASLLEWATERWNIQEVPKHRAIKEFVSI